MKSPGRAPRPSPVTRLTDAPAAKSMLTARKASFSAPSTR